MNKSQAESRGQYAENMVNVFSRVDGSNIESKETISLTPIDVSHTKIKDSAHKRKGSKTLIELKGHSRNKNNKLRTENSEMDDSNVMIE